MPRRTSEIISADPPGAVLGRMSTSGRSRWNRAISEPTSATLITCIMPSRSVPRRPAWAPKTAAWAPGGRVEGAARLWQQDAAGVGQPDLARGPLEQLGAKLALQRADGHRQGRLDEVEAPCGPGEVPLLGDGDEVLKVPQFHD